MQVEPREEPRFFELGWESDQHQLPMRRAGVRVVREVRPLRGRERVRAWRTPLLYRRRRDVLEYAWRLRVRLQIWVHVRPGEEGVRGEPRGCPGAGGVGRGGERHRGEEHYRDDRENSRESCCQSPRDRSFHPFHRDGRPTPLFVPRNSRGCDNTSFALFIRFYRHRVAGWSER